MLRFAILYGEEPLEPWQLQCLAHLAEVPDVRAEIALSPGAAHPPLRWAGIALPGLPTTFADRAPRTLGLPPPAAARARALELDFVLSFSPLAVDRELLELSRAGVWRFQFGDWVTYRGAAGAYWEVYDGCASSTALLVRADPDPDAVTVLREVHLRTQLLSPRRNRQALADRLCRAPAQVCRELQRVGGIGTGAVLRSRAVQRPMPTPSQRARLKVTIGCRMVAAAFRSLFRHDQWNIGIVDRPIAAFLCLQDTAPVRWLPATPRAEFRADPFGVAYQGNPTLFCEYYSYHDDRGFIVASDLHAAAVTRVAIGPEPPVHLSYPYLFEHEGRLFCVPESSAAREISLFEVERFPDRWRKVATLISGHGFADASLFRHDDRWWLAASDVADKGANSELHLWFAPHPTGPWEAHPGNPVKIDVRSARPGGTPFHADGALYRPAQDCSGSYGARIIINRVLELTPTAFREEVAATVDPDAHGPYPAGLHTLSAMGDKTLIDGKRHVFAAAQLRRVLRHYLA